MMVRAVLAAISLVSLAACPNIVSQNKATGPDGKIKGAKKLELTENAAEDRGIVTYPGGDRVDWKLIELPDTKPGGTLDIKLVWTTPRPNLKLAFDVFDKYQVQVASVKKGGRTERETSIKNARGKYFIRVYALRRGDAGTYKLDITFSPPLPDFDWSKQTVPDPPRLADLPSVDPGTGGDKKCEPFSESNPACRIVCPDVSPKQDWPGCRNKCVTVPPNADIKPCADTMICDRRALDRRIKDCQQYFPKTCPDPSKPDPNIPACDNAVFPPVTARITGKKDIDGKHTQILVPVGKSSHIDKTWTCVVLQGSTGKPLRGGEIAIKDVDDSLTGVVTLTPQQIDENKSVQCTAPAKKP